jgi:ribonucleotide monophosphatase NagD (HAD superfamily)
MDYTPLMQRPKTFFIDIDGTILQQNDKWEQGKVADPRDYKELPGSVRLINKWYTDGHRVILTTARGEPYRSRTAMQLENIGLQYHEMIMGLPTGQRILINDRKPQEDIDTAIAINLDRDTGLGNVELEQYVKRAA